MSLAKAGKHALKKVMLATDYGRRAFYLRDVRWKEIRLGAPTGNKWKYLFKNIQSVHVYNGSDSGKAVANLFDHVRIIVNDTDSFFYSLEEGSTWEHALPLYNNTTVDYSRLVQGSLRDMIVTGSDWYAKRNQNFINSLIRYVHRAAVSVEVSGNPIREEMANALLSIEYRPAESFYEAIQRVLFVNQILWQTGHTLNGLGNLDILLYPYYEKDMQNGKLDKERAISLITEFCRVLHRNYEFKSSCLLGDTGQIILLGGADSNGSYIYNDLTGIFIDVVKKLSLPDPKILLKVSADMPDELLKSAVECMATGIGSPLLANNDVIMPAMVDYGYSKADAQHYGVAACWEPLVPGKVSDSNNVRSINFAVPLLNALHADVDYSSFEEFLNAYYSELSQYASEQIQSVTETLKWNEDVVMSSFMDCDRNKKDITEGGAKYNNIGFTGVGMGSAINSLLNIEDYVFRQKKFSLTDLKEAVANDFSGQSDMQEILKSNPRKYGCDIDEVVKLTHEVVDTVDKAFEDKKNPLGGRYKFGVSAPTYVDLGKVTMATPDGRNANQPFSPHISCADPIAYTELMQFAGQLDYTGCRLNGNVVDFMVTPTFLKKNMDKFVLFLKQSIKLGFFEMQMNVVDSKTLIEAKKHPEAFPNLIVRVWGFSAYFKDLPDEYKDLLIDRALKAERAA